MSSIRCLSQLRHRSTVTPTHPHLGGDMRGRTTLVTGCAALLIVAAGATAAPEPPADRHSSGPAMAGFPHLVVIYEENHSFDNLYSTWGSVNGQKVAGLADADQFHTTQVAQNGDAYGCLLQNDVNLASR